MQRNYQKYKKAYGVLSSNGVDVVSLDKFNKYLVDFVVEVVGIFAGGADVSCPMLLRLSYGLRNFHFSNIARQLKKT